MTEQALNLGLASLLTLWPHRATDEATVSQLRRLYHEALEDLSDEAWLLACRAAIGTRVHFPMPAELRELAEGEAERVMIDRHRVNEQRRLIAATDQATLQLTAGAVTPEQAAERADKYTKMVEQTWRAMREGDERRRAALAADYWSEPRRQQRRGMRRPILKGQAPT